jgi:hypothetical protein
MSEQTNPLITGLKLPGRIFQLPSRGLFYTNGELADDIKNGEIHVLPMSALDEISIKNPDQLFSGDAIKAVFSQCIVGINKPTELLAKDVDAIMLFLRTVTYGAAYEFNARHGCDGGKDHSYVANVDELINGMKLIDPTTAVDLYTLTLANGQVVKLKPNKYQQVLDLIKANENKTEITADDQRRNLISMLLGVIISVDGITDQKQITEWIGKLPGPMVRKIGSKIENISDWGPVLTWKCKCRDCGNDFEIELPINPVSFFIE